MPAATNDTNLEWCLLAGCVTQERQGARESNSSPSKTAENLPLGCPEFCSFGVIYSQICVCCRKTLCDWNIKRGSKTKVSRPRIKAVDSRPRQHSGDKPNATHRFSGNRHGPGSKHRKRGWRGYNQVVARVPNNNEGGRRTLSI